MQEYAGLSKSISKLFFNIRRLVAAASMLPVFLILSGPAWANELTGRWSGTLTGTQTYPTQFTFSDAGNLVLTYVDKSGQAKEVELSETGQQIQYVPRGGGVKTHVVESVTPRPDGLTLVLSTRYERARDGYLQQQLTVDSYDIVLDSEGLKTQFVTQTAPHFGLTGEVTENRAEGILQKMSD
ncbi:MAG TPA: hypothetical protein VIE66_09385 [Methylocella sp.]|jgi:hypothetical protein